MKNIIISFAVFVVMICGIFFSLNYLENLCTKYVSLNDEMETLINSSNWDKAYKTSITFLDGWNKSANTISIFIDHSEIDNINNECFKLTQYIKNHNVDESQASVHLIKNYLKHIVNREKVNIQNIL